MSAWLDMLLLVVGIVLAVPVLVLTCECIAAALPIRTSPTRGSSTSTSALYNKGISSTPGAADILPSPRPRLAVLIPAHDEAPCIAATIASLLPQLNAGDRALVVADNCIDETASIARASGAMVIERQDPTRRGKGFALDFGLSHLAGDAPAAVVMIDADTLLADGALDALSAELERTHRPVQAVYLMQKQSGASPLDSVSGMAFMVKNLVRPQGLLRLGLPCLLYGNGMAFAWDTIRAIRLASGNIVEDMQLGIDLAIAGQPPTLCREARVIGTLPDRARAARSQRTRWEHGHLSTLFTQVPRLLFTACTRRRPGLLALALELAVPPLSVLTLLLLVGLLVSLVVAKCLPGSRAQWVFMAELGLMLLSIGLAWARFGRGQYPLWTLLIAPFYVLWKIPIYLRFIVNPQKTWVRTPRPQTPADPKSRDQKPVDAKSEPTDAATHI